MKRFYQFSDTNIAIQMPDDFLVPDNMGVFEKDCLEDPFLYEIKVEDNLEMIVERFCAQNEGCRKIHRENILIVEGNDKELRLIWMPGDEEPYAVLEEIDESHANVWVHTKILPLTHIDTVFGSFLGLEKRVLDKEGLILHSAYMCKDGKAVLFTAPSGTGKSTQADLWEKYRGTRTINGDRSLIVRKEEGWQVYGWPICGSSEICFNETYPLQAVVVLHQSSDNKIRRMKGFEIAQVLLKEMTINRWNMKFQDHAINLIEKLAFEVPVYDFGCNISEEAVECLEAFLQ